MEKNKSKVARISKLRKGRIKGIGPLESFSLKVVGFIDGVRNLPRDSGDGRWISPHIDKEIRSYDEFTSRLWGRLQIEKEEDYAHLTNLMDELVETRRSLDYAEAELEAALVHEGDMNNSRRHGESKLSEIQVTTRRANERAKRLAPLRNRVNTLQSKLIEDMNHFSILYNKLVEENNSTRMICSRIKAHLLQRIDVYWNYVLLKHSEIAKMPTVPSIDVTSHAENIYMENHKAIMEKARAIKSNFSNDEQEII